MEARVALTMWTNVVTNIEYRTKATLFGLVRSAVGKIFIDMCEAIACHLMPRYINIPKERRCWYADNDINYFYTKLVVLLLHFLQESIQWCS